MNHSATRLRLFRSLLAAGRRWGPLRAALLVGGVTLLLFSSAFLLAVDWDGAPAPSAAAPPAEPLGLSIGDEPRDESRRAEPRDEAQPLPDTLSGGRDGTLNVGAALGGVDAEASYDGLIQLVATVYSTPTPALRATPTPTPEAEQPAAPPQQVPAPPEEPPATVAPRAPTPTPQPPAPAAPRAPTPTPQPPAPAAPRAPTPTPQPPAPPDCPTASMSGFAQTLFNAINSERTQQGLPALAIHGCVVYVAQLRSDDMASLGYFSHTSPEGESAFSLLDRYGVPYGWAGENLARNNYPDDQSVGVAIRDLMASEGHRANILRESFTHLGVGAAVDGAGMKYYTMVFIGPP